MNTFTFKCSETNTIKEVQADNELDAYKQANKLFRHIWVELDTRFYAWDKVGKYQYKAMYGALYFRKK